MLGIDLTGKNTTNDLMAGSGGERTFKLISYFENADDARRKAEMAAQTEGMRFRHSRTLSKEESKRDPTTARYVHGMTPTNVGQTTDQVQNFQSFTAGHVALRA